MIKQISILVENEIGTIFEVTDILAQNNINIKAFSVNDTSDFGILRLLVDEYEEAEKVLKENDFGFKVGDVLAVELEHRPGALNDVLKILKEENIGVNYMYSMVIKDDKPLMVIDTHDSVKATKVLTEKGIIVE
jgi:hypothetical protein